MKIKILETKKELGAQAAQEGIKEIKKAISQHDEANIILATGASQFEVLKDLRQADIDWGKVTMFHLDEYIGIKQDHPASFRKYLKERFVDQVQHLKAYHFINGNAQDPQRECQRLNQLILQQKIAVAFVGIGENGHLAFNDPPADFETDDPYIVVELDEACRRQQMGEGWFGSLQEVPNKAISMSVRQILKSEVIICSVPDQRKAQAVKDCFEGAVTPHHPASILQTHDHCTIFLDKGAASLLHSPTLQKYS